MIGLPLLFECSLQMKPANYPLEYPWDQLCQSLHPDSSHSSLDLSNILKKFSLVNLPLFSYVASCYEPYVPAAQPPPSPMTVSVF
jgi:hypothetical protein